MRNPVFAEEFETDQLPMSMWAFGGPTLTIGIRTVTQNRDGLKLYPFKTVVIEIRQGDEVAAFDLPPSMIRAYAKRLNDFANAIEKEETCRA